MAAPDRWSRSSPRSWGRATALATATPVRALQDWQRVALTSHLDHRDDAAGRGPWERKEHAGVPAPPFLGHPSGGEEFLYTLKAGPAGGNDTIPTGEPASPAVKLVPIVARRERASSPAAVARPSRLVAVVMIRA
jgi:hypothetical protein